ncbi:MAG: glycosyltransferase family 2 protein [bacterium]
MTETTTPAGLSVVVPVYNEEKAIGAVIDEILESLERAGRPYEIIAVDDGSRDRTAEILKEKPVRVLSHPRNRGYGAALKTGISAARHGRVAIVDGDGTYEPGDLGRLMDSMQGCDMVVGARIGKRVQIPWSRRPAKWVLTKLANLLTDTKIPDLNSGFRIMDKAVAEKFFAILPANFSFTSTITMALLINGYDVKFVQTGYRKRQGKSKIRPVQDTVNFLSLILRTGLYFAPLKVFLPMSLFIIALSLLKMTLVDILLIQNMTDSTLLLLLGGVQVGMLGLLADLIDKRSPPLWKKK